MPHAKNTSRSPRTLTMMPEEEPTTSSAETEPNAPPRPSSKEEWAMNKAAIARYGRNRQWDKVLEILVAISKRQKDHEVYKALAHRVWIALKSETPVTDVVLALFHLLHTLGIRHEVAGPIAALAHFMAKHRTPDHPDRALAIAQAQQMLDLVVQEVGVRGDEAFKRWVAHHRLDDPNLYIPSVLNCLEVMIGGDWWFDPALLQEEARTARP